MTILVLRGHVRLSFCNDGLYNLVKNIYSNNADLKVYIHTWSIVQNNVSWRHLDTRNIPVTKELIYWYFKDLTHLIKHIIIDDDSEIELNGKTDGTVLPKVKTPLIGWKRFWYGKYKIINYIYENLQFENKKELIINCRLDVLCNSNSFKSEKILEFIELNKYTDFCKNIFISDSILYDNQNLSFCQKIFVGETLLFYGIDNLYLGNIDTQYILAKHFNNNLDNIIDENKDVITQEHLVPIENDKLFSKGKNSLIEVN